MLYFHVRWGMCYMLGIYPTFFPVKLNLRAHSITSWNGMGFLFNIPNTSISFTLSVTLLAIYFYLYFQNLNGFQSSAYLTHNLIKHTIPLLPRTFQSLQCQSNLSSSLEYVFVYFHTFPLVKCFVSQKMIHWNCLSNAV